MSFRNYYDTSYGRTRGDSSVSRSTTTDRPASVTARYINTTPTYKSSSIPIRRERSATREQNESPITAIANKYANYKLNKDDKPATKYTDKKDSFNKLAVPTLITNKSRDVSPVSTSSKYSLNRSSRHLSPDRRNMTTSSLTKGRSRDPSPTDRDKDIPNKTDKSSGYNSLSSFKLYPRTSTYTRPSSRTENKPEITVNRYAIANRIANNYLRSPSIEKSSRTSVSPINHTDNCKIDNDRLSNGKPECDAIGNEVKVNRCKEIIDETMTTNECKPIENGKPELNDDVPETITVITRHTSPTPPGNSAYIRSRRAEMAKTLEKTITRSRVKPEMVDKEIQSDRLDDTSRTSRFAGTSRTSVSNWSPYTPNISHYTGYAGRYSTQYGSTRESAANNSNSENYNNNSFMENASDNSDRSNEVSESEKIETINVPENKPNVIENSTKIKLNSSSENKDNEETSEIVINVNLKLKKAKTTELVSPEITITNSQLPPQPPKQEGSPTKVKKVKIRKSSIDTSSDSSPKKKVVKKRSKSVSSTDSDQSNENKSNTKTSGSHSPSPPKSLSRNSSSSNLRNNLKQKSSRESNSPESSTTLSTQSSISEDESLTKSKTIDLSRTSADDVTISLDKSNKQQTPTSPKNEGTEEAKSFLIRTLAPVTNLFKIKQPESSEDSHWLDSSISESTGKDVSNLITESDPTSKSKTDNIIASNSDNVIQLKSIKQFDAEENQSWLGNNMSSSNSINQQRSPSEKINNKKIKHVESGERAWWLESNSESKNDNQNNVPSDTSEPKTSKNCKFSNYDKEEKPWWLDSCANIPEGVQRLTPPRKVSSDSEKSDKYDFYKIRHNGSGDKEWWLTSNENTSSNKESQTGEISKSSSDHRSFPLRRIRHVESGERPWWLSSSKNIPEGVEKLPTPPPRDSDTSDSDEVDAYVRKPTIPPFPLNLPDDEPLGDRRSPEGLETPRETEDCGGRRSPYENSIYRRGQGYHKGDKYIARYTEIDDLLPGQMYSPYVDVILVRRTGQKFDGDSSECEEIDPTQVRIHDSTAQRPVIKKIRCRSELELVDYHEDSSMEDAQVFKDGEEMLDLQDGSLDASALSPRRVRSPNCRSERRKHLIQQQLDSVLLPSLLIPPKADLKLPITNSTRVIPPIRDYKENFEFTQILKRRRDLIYEDIGNDENNLEIKDYNEIKCGIYGNRHGSQPKKYGNHDDDNTNDYNTKEDNIYNSMRNLNIAENGIQYTKGLKQRIHNGTLGHSVTLHSPATLTRLSTPAVSPDEKMVEVENMVGIVSKAKEELAKSQSKEIIKSSAISIQKVKTESELQWEELEKKCKSGKFSLCDLDFSDLQFDGDEDISSLSSSSGIPPPPPNMLVFGPTPPPPPTSLGITIPAPPKSSDSESSIKKNRKTVKLFWREINEFPMPSPMKAKVGGFIWDDLPSVVVDTNMLEHLFESKSNDLIMKKLSEPKRNTMILDAKRSNAINIAMKKLPPLQTIKAAIMKMDATTIGKEGIEKILTMLPTEEEICKIQEAQNASPDIPLGSAEQFLMTLASISELSSRLKLWVFKLDFDNLEREIAEPLMDLKLSTEQLKVNKTFKNILSVLRTVGSFLNGCQVKGFRLEYLSKVIEVKDTVHKHSLLYHICEMVNDKFPDSSDFYSEMGPVLRASKVDFQALSVNLMKLESDCKASFDHLKQIAAHDSTQIKTKINEFLTDAAQRIILLKFIESKIMIRYNKFLLYLGVPPSDIGKTTPSSFLKIISEFALEYRTTRERVLLKNSQRERNKIREKMVLDNAASASKNEPGEKDCALTRILEEDSKSSLCIFRKPSKLRFNSNDADEELIDKIVKAASPKKKPAARKRARLSETSKWASIFDKREH